MIELTEEKLLDIFFASWQIPIGLFSMEGTLTKLYAKGGQRQTQFYLDDSRFILESERGAAVPVMRYDLKGSCWCLIPLAHSRLLFGPVQTGRNPDYPYREIPEHTWNGFREICRCLTSMLLTSETELEEKEESYTAGHTARRMFLEERGKNELNSFDEIFDCVRHGDAGQLDLLVGSEAYAAYLDRMMPDLSSARYVFYFHLAKTYHAAQETTGALQDLSPLIGLYLAEAEKYRSTAAFKAGMQRSLYDFTRYVRRYTDGRHTPLISKAYLFIDENIYTPIRVEEIARYCAVSVSTLQHRFRQETGRSVSDRIRMRKIRKACFFLKHTNLSCGDIAYKLGYNSQSYFIRQFRTEMALTPQKYREAGSPSAGGYNSVGDCHPLLSHT